MWKRDINMKLITIKLICRVCLYCDLEYENEFVEKRSFIKENFLQSD
jgi:hypothetical protein